MKKIFTVLLTVIIAVCSISGAMVVDAASKNTVKTSITKIESKAKGFKVTFKKKSKIKGYQIQYSTSSKFKKSSTKTKTISKAKTTSATISKLKGCNKKYYVRIRTYKVSKGKKIYSGWSKSKKVTTLKHKYNKATCQKPKTCKYCKKEKGEALKHNYSNGECLACGKKLVAEANGYKVGDVTTARNTEGDTYVLEYLGEDRWKDQKGNIWTSYQNEDGSMHWWMIG